MCAIFLFAACGEPEKTPTPLDALKAYNQAIKEKDAAKIKNSLSKASLKMAQDEAGAQNISVDEIVGRETLYSPIQTTVKIRNQKIAGETATIEVENSYGTWDVVPFVKEDGRWKIAKERYADELMKQSQEDNRLLDEQINKSRQ